MQRQAEDEGRPRRQRQDGQDDRRVRRAPGAPPALQAGHPLDDEVQGPRRGRTTPTSATPSSSRSRGRSRRRSAGASSRSSRAPASTAARATSSSRRPRPPRRSTPPPTRAATRDEADRRRRGAPTPPSRPTTPTPTPPTPRRRPGVIQPQSRLRVADNTGARSIQCIRVMGRSLKTTAGVGDVIIASVKQAIPNAAVKKGDVVRAVIVRTAKEYGRPDGSYIRFDENAAVLINNQGNPRGTRIFGPGRPRAARPQLHEDRVARAGGAVMAAAPGARRAPPRCPRSARGDTVVVLDRQGRRQARRRRARRAQPAGLQEDPGEVRQRASSGSRRSRRPRSSSRASTSPSATRSRARAPARPTGCRRSSRAGSSISPSRCRSAR